MFNNSCIGSRDGDWYIESMTNLWATDDCSKFFILVFVCLIYLSHSLWPTPAEQTVLIQLVLDNRQPEFLHMHQSSHRVAVEYQEAKYQNELLIGKEAWVSSCLCSMAFVAIHQNQSSISLCLHSKWEKPLSSSGCGIVWGDTAERCLEMNRYGVREKTISYLLGR